MAERWKLTEFTLDDAEEFDKICDEAELAKDAGEDDPYKVSKKQLNQVFGDHYVILPSDEFKGTGVQQNKCGEYGRIVATHRVMRGLAPTDNSTDPNNRSILGPKKEFTYKAPTPYRDAPDTGGASGSNDPADQTAQSKGKGSKNKRKEGGSQDKGLGKRFRVASPTNDEVRLRIQSSEVDRTSLGHYFTQTWSDASSVEKAIGDPDGSKQEYQEYAILDPKEPWVTAA